MSVIRYYGDPVLRKKAVPISDFNREFEELCEQLTDWMYEYDGVGLAAPQVGISQRFVVVDVSKEGDKPIVLVNPEITWKSEEKVTDSEGCLSIPNIRGNVERYASISVKAFSPSGEEFQLERIDGLFARAIQHEIDHLDGILFVDKIPPVKKQLIAGKLKKIAKQNRK